ncbi:proton channel OTOP2-like isoform X2 [Actinia tenebrosa]|uniref:Proton channel OTOP2-like isoform X2 n=1 Tax=Actinia tenebrosa TaxID=6105 RepID=A0A6P8IWI4_ACTTE|nr:proton channel OTOP2-like isoform X2 [Actinia tenebrosa]
MDRRNQGDPEAIVPVIEDPPSSSISSYHTAVPPEPSCCESCKAFFWSLLSSPFYKTEISTLSLVHFISTLAIGISLSIGAEIDEVKHITKTSLYVFLIIYMGISIVWIIGAFCCGNKSGCCLAERQHDGHIPGYLIIGVTFLCIGSSFITAVEFLPFVFSKTCNFTNITSKGDVESELKSEAIFSFTKFIFLILQLYFFCRFSSKTFFDSCSMKIFLMHIIAVNLCTWFYIIVDESVDHTSKPPKYPTDRCPPFKAIEGIRKAIDGYLYPFSIEYSVMSSVLLFLLWFRLKPREHQQSVHPSAETTQSTNESHLQNTRWQQIKIFLFDKCCKEGIPQGEEKPVSFWRSAICGYIFGVVVLIFILVIVTVLAVVFKVDQKDAVYVFQGSKIAIHSLMSFICLFGLKYLREHEPGAQTSHTIVDTALIMIGVSGCYLMVGFHITATGSVYPSPCTDNETYPATQLSCKFLRVSLADYVCALIQFTLQAFFIVRALRRCSLVWPSKGKISSALVVRRCSAFLSIANIGMWVMDTFQLKNISIAEVPEILAYTKKTWLILSHVAFPLCIFFRLHSVFCCFEIVINRFVVVLSEDKTTTVESVSSEDGEVYEDALGINS